MDNDYARVELEVDMPMITTANILIMASSGFEQAELQGLLNELRSQGATVHVAAPDRAPIRGRKGRAWGMSVTPDKSFGEVDSNDYDALLLPGGVMNPDSFRLNPAALQLIREFIVGDKVVAAVSHAPWLFTEINALRGKASARQTIKTDGLNASVQQDGDLMVERGFITSRTAANLPVFVAMIMKELQRDVRPAQGTSLRESALLRTKARDGFKFIQKLSRLRAGANSLIFARHETANSSCVSSIISPQVR